MKSVALVGFESKDDLIEIVKILEYAKYSFVFNIDDIIDRIDYTSISIFQPANEQHRLYLVDEKDVKADIIINLQQYSTNID